jgi:demethylmenaquinone methyltransferase / 2-methoxy-6-polyprenyl-1,4-benzoquinol methylase
VSETGVIGKADAVRTMFTRIAGRYDLMNSVMTGGRHHAWRRRAAAALAAAPAGPALDLATGTGDLALAVRAARPRDVVVAADFSEAMLGQARAKLATRGERLVLPLAADALALPFRNAAFACVTSAFLLRNLADLPAGLAEMRRITMRGGLVAALEITRPGVPGWDALFGLYFNRLVPLIGALVAGDRAAYTYLPRSVERFVTPAELARLMSAAGLRDVRYRRLGLGTIALHVGTA